MAVLTAYRLRVMRRPIRSPMAAYKVALDQGMSRERAASLAKNLTVNFNRKGRQAREIGALYAFFNAAIQGTARMAETLKGPMGRRIIYGGVLLGAVNAMIGMAMMGGGDDDEPDRWDQVPEFIKERSIVIPLGRECIDPAETAQVRLLKHKPQQEFSCPAPDVAAGGCKSQSSHQ